MKEETAFAAPPKRASRESRAVTAAEAGTATGG